MYNKVYIEITNICNMHCSFCHGHSRPPRQMTAEEFSFILDRLSGQTNYIYYHLMGEPLTHPLLPGFIKSAALRGYKSIVTTNGTLLRQRGDDLLSSGLYKANISLHSFETENREGHAKYIKEIANFAKKAAAQGTIVVLRLWNKGYEDAKNKAAVRLLEEAFPGGWVENTRGMRIRDRIFLEWGERFEWPDKDSAVKGTEFHCYGLKDQFGILSDGTVVPCCLDSDGVINLGNIFTDDLQAILQSPRATALTEGFRQGTASEELCRRCGYAQRFV